MFQLLQVRSKFPLGRLVVTRGVSERMADDEDFADFVLHSLRRHAQGDWGDLGEEDVQENEFSLSRGLRLFSLYGDERKIYVITEADRSATTVLFPSEY